MYKRMYRGKKTLFKNYLHTRLPVAVPFCIDVNFIQLKDNSQPLTHFNYIL